VHYVIHFLTAVVIIYLTIDPLALCWVRRVYHFVYRLNYRTNGWVIYLDLDGLKRINDQEGHGKGDQLLREFGKQLFWYSKGCSFRVGGDEFVVLTRNLEKAEEIVSRIKDVSFSYGIGKNEQEAEKIMYQCKGRKIN
jgi:diguanylate cyclase (GGDEF)-like protein